MLEVEVRMVAEHHPDRRIQDLGRHAVTVLIGEPRVRIPAAAMEILEPRAEHREVLRALPGSRDEPHGDRLVEAVDDEEVTALRIVHHVRRAVAKALVDPIDVGAGRLGDVRVGGDDRLRHAQRLPARRTVPGLAPVGSPSR